MSKKEPLGCICLTCGVRNDFTHPDGFCQNGHDNWLEYSDITGEDMIEKQHNVIMHYACTLTGLSKNELKKAFLNPKITHIPIHRHIWDEIEQIMISNNPFDWNSIEINDWELTYRMQRASGEAPCPICKKMIKDHPIETRTTGGYELFQLCYGVWAKT